MTNAVSGMSARERYWGVDEEPETPPVKADPCEVFERGQDHDFDACPTFSVKDAKLFLARPGETHDIAPSDIQQNQTGDCYLDASLAALAGTDKGREHLRSMIQENKGKDGSVESYTVTFKVRDNDAMNKSGLRETYHDRKIEVDASFPKGTNGVVDGEVWPAVVEKAYAELNGGYRNTVHGGYPADVFKSLGVKSDHKDFGFWYGGKSLVKDLNAGKAITVYTHVGIVADGLVANHAYSVRSAFTNEDGETWVRLRNPWGHADPPPMPLDDLQDSLAGVDVAAP